MKKLLGWIWIAAGVMAGMPGMVWAAAPYGNGSDGDVIMLNARNINTDSLGASQDRNGNFADGIAYQVLGNPTSRQIHVAGGPVQGFMAGDMALLINLKGTAADYGRVGTYEIVNVQSADGNYITLAQTPAKIYADSDFAGQKVIIQRVPQYANVTMGFGATLTASAWDGLNAVPCRTGVVAMLVSGTLTINGGIIQGSAMGYRGYSVFGQFSSGPNLGGEAYCDAGAGQGGRAGGTAAELSGGPGVSGGGGGASCYYPPLITTHAGTGSPRGGGGGGGGSSNNMGNAGGGGGGGYATEGNGGNGFNNGQAGSGAQSGNGGEGDPGGSHGGGGGGGGTYGSPELNYLFFGSGGGCGAGTGWAGDKIPGSGGGLLLIQAKNLNVMSGLIQSNGGNASLVNYGGGSGGGAGGSIKIICQQATLGDGQVTASFGNSCNGDGGYPGGYGGYGRIAVFSTSMTGSSWPAAYALTYTLPSAPTGLTGIAAAYNRVDLSWTDQSSNEEGFAVERSANGSSNWLEIGSATAAAYTDHTVGGNTTYYYRVKAYNKGESDYSNVANVTTPSAPATPTPTITSVITATPTPAGANEIKAYPNPARDWVTFAYSASEPVTATLDVYQASGERVARIQESKTAGGLQSTVWKCEGVATGVYLLTLTLKNKEGGQVLRETKKIAVVR